MKIYTISNGLPSSFIKALGLCEVYVYDTLNQLTDVWVGADATDPASITSYDSKQTYTLDPPDHNTVDLNSWASMPRLTAQAG